jgi:hypothetical protein
MMRVLPLTPNDNKTIPENRLKFGSKCKMSIGVFATFHMECLTYSSAATASSTCKIATRR